MLYACLMHLENVQILRWWVKNMHLDKREEIDKIHEVLQCKQWRRVFTEPPLSFHICNMSMWICDPTVFFNKLIFSFGLSPWGHGWRRSCKTWIPVSVHTLTAIMNKRENQTERWGNIHTQTTFMANCDGSD